MLCAGTYKGMDLSTLIKTLPPKAGGLSALQVIEVNLRLLSNALSPMLVTLLGIVTDVIWEQPEKAYALMLVTLLGIVNEVNWKQSRNTDSPMLVTLFGMVIEVNW